MVGVLSAVSNAEFRRHRGWSENAVAKENIYVTFHECSTELIASRSHFMGLLIFLVCTPSELFLLQSFVSCPPSAAPDSCFCTLSQPQSAHLPLDKQSMFNKVCTKSKKVNIPVAGRRKHTSEQKIHVTYS